MGGKQRGQKRKGGSGQARLDHMLTLRRSTRGRSQAAEKQETEPKLAKVELAEDTQSLDIGPSQEKTISLVSSDNSKNKHRPRGGNKEKVVTKKEIQLSIENQREILKNFDINPIYGPCRGISRRDRYERALNYEITPVPEEIILKIIEGHNGDFTFQNCIWDQNKLLKLHV